MKDNFMVDLETLGTRPYSIILSIGVVQFNLSTGALGNGFYQVIDQDSCREFGLTSDQSTIDWWKKQDAKIRAKLYKNPEPLPQVLKAFSTWLKTQCSFNKYMWGNSASFDLGLLSQAYERVGLVVPWAFWNERCCRTIVALNPSVKDRMAKPKDAHSPIADCKYQIEYVTKTIQSITK